jgi:hypothetical protein
MTMMMMILMMMMMMMMACTSPTAVNIVLVRACLRVFACTHAPHT